MLVLRHHFFFSPPLGGKATLTLDMYILSLRQSSLNPLPLWTWNIFLLIPLASFPPQINSHTLLLISLIILLGGTVTVATYHNLAKAKVLKSSFIEFISMRYKLASSAYAFIFDSVPSGSINPFMFLLLLIARDRVSATITYSNGDSGHPCLTPLVSKNASDRKPFAQILLLVLVYIIFIQLIISFPNPNFSRHLSK